MALREVEGQIEEFVEGVMARAFRSGLQPVEIGRRLRRVAVRDRRVNVKGIATIANRFTVHLATDDYNRIIPQGPSTARDLIDEVRNAAARENLEFPGPVTVQFVEDPERRRGTFSIERSFDEGSVVVHAELTLADGRTVNLGTAGIRIGRHPDNDIVIDESNVSRFHAQVVPDEDRWVIFDNRSTNGTRVNDQRIGTDGRTEVELTDGDSISVGPASFGFRLL